MPDKPYTRRRRPPSFPYERKGLVKRTRSGTVWLLIPDRSQLIQDKKLQIQGAKLLISGRRDIPFNQDDAALLGHGDYVKARLSSTKKGGETAFLIKVLKRNRTRFPARLNLRDQSAILIPLAPLMPEQLPCDLKNSPLQDELQDGMLVMVQQKEPKDSEEESFQITQSLGDPHDPAIATSLAIAGCDIPEQWPDEVIQQLAAQATEVLSMPDRRNCTDTTFCTIDSEGAQIYDDAVWCKPLPNGDGWHLQVAIADVSAYVLPDTPLDTEARRRGTSVYFKDKIVPMLPKELSENLCSLVEGKERPAVICDMRISPEGDIADYEFFRATIRSAGRLTYAQAQAVLDKRSNPANPAHKLRAELRQLSDVSAALDMERHWRGAFDIDLPDESVVPKPSGKPKTRTAQSAAQAKQLIANAMVAANTCAAEQLHRLGSSSPVLQCPPPSAVDWQALLKLMQARGLNCEGLMRTPSAYQNLLQQIQPRDDRDFLKQQVARSLQPAEYSAKSGEHFPLALERYTYFTSPIRRYLDLLVHRQLLGTKIAAPNKHTCTELSELERRAKSARRQADDHLQYLETLPLKGQWCPAQLTDIRSDRIRVQLDQTGVYADQMRPEKKSLLNRASAAQTELEWKGQQLHLGDKLEVRLSEVAPEQQEAWFNDIRQQCPEN